MGLPLLLSPLPSTAENSPDCDCDIEEEEEDEEDPAVAPTLSRALFLLRCEASQSPGLAIDTSPPPRPGDPIPASPNSPPLGLRLRSALGDLRAPSAAAAGGAGGGILDPASWNWFSLGG